MVSWAFDDLDALMHLIFPMIEPGATGEARMSLAMTRGPGSLRSIAVSVTRFAC